MGDLVLQISMVVIWIGLIGFFVFIEMETAQLVSIWFAGGALAAVILAALDVAIEFQLLAFAVVSVIALAVIKFLLPKFGLAQSREKFDTTANESIVGKELVVLTAASFFEPGEGKVNGVLWNIYTDEGEKVFPGQIVLIKEIRGNRLIVELKKKGI